MTKEVLQHLCEAYLNGTLHTTDLVSLFGLTGMYKQCMSQHLDEYFDERMDRYQQGDYDYEKDSEDMASSIIKILTLWKRWN